MKKIIFSMIAAASLNASAKYVTVQVCNQGESGVECRTVTYKQKTPSAVAPAVPAAWSRAHIKIRYFDRSGFTLWLKRLESVKFPWPKPLDVEEVILVSANDLKFILDGVNIWSRFKPVHFENII